MTGRARVDEEFILRPDRFRAKRNPAVVEKALADAFPRQRGLAERGYFSVKTTVLKRSS